MFSLLKTYFPIKTSYHKKLLSSSLVSKLDEIMLDDILFLMSCFENTNIAFSQNTPQHHMEEYFSIALEQYKPIFKIATTSSPTKSARRCFLWCISCCMNSRLAWILLPSSSCRSLPCWSNTKSWKKPPSLNKTPRCG